MMTDALHVVSAKHKLFRRTGERMLPLLEHRAKSGSARALRVVPEVRRKLPAPPPTGNAADTGMATLLARYAPPAIIFNETQEAVHLFGDVNPFIQAKEGSASLIVNRLLLDALVPVASALLYRSIKDQSSLLSDPIVVTLRNGEQRSVRVSAHSLKNSGVERLTMLCFEAQAVALNEDLTPVDVTAETMTRVNGLERELAATRDSLQATIEELETSNEELQATNEELMASNEELQSSNEELQSVNEELNTVNAEFQEKMLLLNKSNADLESMGRATGVATVFVDADMNITRFSPDAATIFKLRATDIGRPLDEISHRLHYPGLMDDLALTLKTNQVIEREVASSEGERMLFVRILPYAIASSTRRGAVTSFVDVSAYHDAKRLQAILDGLPEHVAVLDPDGTIRMVNAAWRRFAIANGDPELKTCGTGCNYLSACGTDFAQDGDAAAAALRGVQSVLDGTLPSFSMEYPCHSPKQQRWFVMNAAPILGPDLGVVVSHINVTPWFVRNAS